jgi:DnaK suppressor protein
MRKAKLDQYRKLLQQRQLELGRAFSRNASQTRAEKEEGTEDYIDYAVNSYEKEFLLSLTNLERQELLQIEDALRRIKSGVYGTCQQCGTEIPVKRLEATPWARHCVSCQDLEERGLLPKYAYSRLGTFDDAIEPEDEALGRPAADTLPHAQETEEE